MSIFLILAFLFFIGSMFGWCLELVFRKFFSSANPNHKWINPGFLVGPYVPLYGFGLCILYLIAEAEKFRFIGNTAADKALLFIIMAICMTVIEYIAGILLLKIFNVRLWDYSKEWANLNGLICPKFSFFWALLGAFYYFAIHSHILNALNWLSQNLVFSFVIGMFYGIFIIDFSYSTNLAVKIKSFAKDNDIIVKYEQFKSDIQRFHEKNALKTHFLLSMHSSRSLKENLQHYYNHALERQQLERAFRHRKNRKENQI